MSQYVCPMERDSGDRPTIDEARETAGLLFAVTEQLRHGFEEVAGRLGLTPQQARTLLACSPPLTMRSLANHLACDASNVTGIADRLEARGLIVRHVDPSDRRVKLLMLTNVGTELRDRLDAAVAEASPLMTGLTAAEGRSLHALLAKAECERRPRLP